MRLSPKQKEIVDHIDGALLVKAGPGSGKTRVLTERVKKLLSTHKRGKVLALTFSNMAADEMRTRLETDPAVGDSIDRATISTIHSFCIEIIQSRGYLVGLRPDISLFESESDRLSILRSIVSAEPEYAEAVRNRSNPESFLNDCLMMISEQKRALIPPEACEVEYPFPELYQNYTETLASQNAMDYDDILFYAYRILADNRDVVKLYNSVYRFICIDEAQDLNNAQYQVIQALCAEGFHNVMMVGDENQSVYAFNGSSSQYMSELFIRDFDPVLYSLDENYRSARRVIQFANRLTGDKKDLSKYYYKGEVSLSAYNDESDEAQAVLNKISELMEYGHKDIENALTYDNIAIIGRNKYVFSGVEEALIESQIPFHYKKTQSGIVCETDHMQVFDLILRLLMNPKNFYHKQKLCKIVSASTAEYRDEENSAELIAELISSSKFNWLNIVIPLISVDGVIEFDNVLNTIRANIPSNLDDDDRYLLERDIDEWQKHWIKFKSQVAKEYRTLVSFRHAISLGRTQYATIEAGVALLTGHMSKGLEYEVVFIIGMAEGTFPDYRAVNNGGEALKQEQNNLYVAVTRAKRILYLSYPSIRQMPWGVLKRQVPSRYIRQIMSQDRVSEDIKLYQP
jgi:DNA helicase-2/ATP-dependent DNA helicase PcrA